MGSEQKRAFLAVILSGLVLFTWQAFFAPKNPEKETVNQAVSNNSSTTQATTNQNDGTKGSTKTNGTKFDFNSVDQSKVQESVLSFNGHEVTIDNYLRIRGMKSTDSVFNYQSIVGEKSDVSISLLIDGKVTPVFFELLLNNSATEIRGENKNYGITFFGRLLENGKFNYSLKSKNPYMYRISINSEKKELENQQLRQFVYFGKDVEFNEVGEEFSADEVVKWLGVDFNFHLFSLIFNNKIPMSVKGDLKGVLTATTGTPVTELGGDVVFTKKNYDRLVELGSSLELSVDFGIFGILAVPILRGLQFFYKYIPNYGVAIIILTLIIRLITFPLQYKSFKSMKKMQKIQPELNKLKEKFKDDPQRMQKETMELFKRAGANPLGGCFPLLLQMPVFFAFYKVLYAAVELVEAPFFGWITDLSLKDPYFVLPVLMTVTMFLQHKLNPSTTADPTQQKVMMAMPIVFGFIMKDLPSGLVLYICVSTIFGIIQQLFVYKTTD